MVSSKDLMIGDWIRFKYTKEIAQVSGVSSIEGLKVLIKDEEVDWFPPNIIEPILLTQEILEKNGFEQGFGGGKNCLNYNEYADNKGDFDLYICNGIREGSTCGEIYEYVFTAIQYIHELQHALKLCGIDKEIIL